MSQYINELQKVGKSIQTAGYVRARTVSGSTKSVNKQHTQLVIELNSSLGQILGS